MVCNPVSRFGSRVPSAVVPADVTAWPSKRTEVPERGGSMYIFASSMARNLERDALRLSLFTYTYVSGLHAALEQSREPTQVQAGAVRS